MKALVTYGRSKAVYRVDHVVSGRMTPTRPLPASCNPFSWLMTVKLESNEVTPSPAGTVALVVLVEVEFPHAATMIDNEPANTIAVDDLSLRNCIALLLVLVVPVGNDEKGWATVGWSPGRPRSVPLLRWLPADDYSGATVTNPQERSRNPLW